jgi:hypothetical protein
MMSARAARLPKLSGRIVQLVRRKSVDGRKTMLRLVLAPVPSVALLALMALVGTATPLSAQGLVQISLAGALNHEGGARIEVEIGAFALPAGASEREARQLDLHLHLANATSAPDLAQIVSMRLNSEGFETFLTEPQDGRVQLFVQHALFVRLRLGRGLKSIVTLTNSAPGAIKVMPPQGATGAAKLAITASTFHGHTELHGQQRFAIEIEGDMISSAISERLFDQSVPKNWISKRPGIDAWQPLKMSDGATIEGVSIELTSQADWRLEVEIPRRER